MRPSALSTAQPIAYSPGGKYIDTFDVSPGPTAFGPPQSELSGTAPLAAIASSTARALCPFGTRAIANMWSSRPEFARRKVIHPDRMRAGTPMKAKSCAVTTTVRSALTGEAALAKREEAESCPLRSCVPVWLDRRHAAAVKTSRSSAKLGRARGTVVSVEEIARGVPASCQTKVRGASHRR